MSHFNYCPCVWHFGRRNDVRKVENVQYRSLKYVFNDFKSPYCELRKRADRPVMYVQRLRAILIEVYKAYFNIGPKYTGDIFTNSNQVYSTRNNKMLIQPKCFSFNHGIYSFRYQGARLWNSLNPHFKEVDSLSDFKVSLRKWQGGDCEM